MFFFSFFFFSAELSLKTGNTFYLQVLSITKTKFSFLLYPTFYLQKKTKDFLFKKKRGDDAGQKKNPIFRFENINHFFFLSPLFLIIFFFSLNGIYKKESFLFL